MLRFSGHWADPGRVQKQVNPALDSFHTRHGTLCERPADAYIDMKDTRHIY